MEIHSVAVPGVLFSSRLGIHSMAIPSVTKFMYQVFYYDIIHKTLFILHK